MKKKSFTVVLPSNSNPETFPNNNANKFSVEFKNPITLSDQYEVALIEMTYKNEIVALKNNFFQLFTLKASDPLFKLLDNKSPEEWLFNSYNLNSFYYFDDTGYDPADVWSLFDKLEKYALISIVDDMTNEINIQIRKKDVLLILSNHLKKLLNFNIDTFSRKFTGTSGGFQRKEKVDDKQWSIQLIPLYALKYKRIVLKSKNESITHDQFLQRWRERIPKKFIDIKVEKNKTGGIFQINLKKQTPLKGDDWCIFEVEDELKNDLLYGQQQYLAKRYDEESYAVANPISKESKSHEWAVKVYSNKMTPKFMSQEESLKDIIRLDVDTIESADSLLKLLNVKSDADGYKFQYNSATHRMSVIVPQYHRLQMDEVLQSMMGFGTRTMREGTTVGVETPVLKRNVNNIFVYCNIIDYVHVGNTEAPLLRQFPIASHKHMLINREFINKIFIPLNRYILDRIDVSIHDEAGALIPFKEGIVTVTLEFQPIVM